MGNRRAALLRDLAKARASSIESFDALGFERGIVSLIEVGRWLLEDDPALYGRLLMDGVLYQATIDSAGRRADHERKRLRWDFHRAPTAKTAIIPATVFTTVAYGHAYYDGNKRTGFLSGTSTAIALGFVWREPEHSWEDLLEDVRLFVEGNESEDPRRVEALSAREVAK